MDSQQDSEVPAALAEAVQGSQARGPCRLSLMVPYCSNNNKHESKFEEAVPQVAAKIL